MQKKKLLSTVKDNIVRVRMMRGYTQTDLAKKLGTSQRLIAYYESKASNIPINKLEDIANALDVPVTDLITSNIMKTEPIPELDVRLAKRLKQIEALPRRAKDSVLHTINVAIEHEEMKRNKKEKARPNK